MDDWNLAPAYCPCTQFEAEPGYPEVCASCGHEAAEHNADGQCQVDMREWE